MWSISDAELTSAQRQAVEHLDGPLLILAGPGSGKTRVVTHRVAWLLQQGVPAHQIVALTFTNKAADEMRERVRQLVTDRDIWVSTFHRFCARLLRQYAHLVGLEPNFTIYDADNSLRALRHVMNAEAYELAMYTPQQVANQISWAKNNLITPEDYKAQTHSSLSSIVEELYPIYQQKLLAACAVDFDDILLHVANLLSHNPEIRRALDERFRYVLIDEYQDTNLTQYAILRGLSIDHPNLAATGDPDQSIFGWRGANLNNILEFESDFPNVRIVRLEQNYRSTKRILRVADGLIANNLRRKPKHLFTDNDEGRPVRIVLYPTERDEADAIAARIAADVGSGHRSPGDFAIFYRVNALSRTLEMSLRAIGIPYQLVKAVEFFQRKEIKDVMAYLSLINNPRDDVALLRVINMPPRGIGAKTISRLVEYAHRRGLSLLDAARDADQIKTMANRARTLVATFAQLMDRLAQQAAGSAEESVGMVLSESGYQEHLKSAGSEEDQERLANIEELLTVARDFDDRHPDDGGLEVFLEQNALVGDTDDWSERSEHVTLMTLHSAKGLEFPVVYLIAAEEGILPHERSRNEPDQLEEERRLMFVGLTRAQDELQISIAHRRGFRGQRKLTVASPFLMELPREDVEQVDLGRPDRFEPPPEEAVYVHRPPRTKQDPAELAASLSTAAELAAQSSRSPIATETASEIDLEIFRVGMAVSHPEYGLGKIAALSGPNANRIATINFALAGQKKFNLAASKLRPAGSVT